MNATLRTARFILRQPQLGDAEPIARYLNDFEVSGNLQTKFACRAEHQ